MSIRKCCILLISIPSLLLLLTLLGVARTERETPAIGRFVTVDGIRLHYVMAGQGPDIILVHGASSNLREFSSDLLPRLARTHRVIAFDRPGYGYSERPHTPTWPDPSRQADLLLKAAEQLGMRKPLLVGHSWAGALVMSALVDMPERISGGVLISGVAGHWAGPLNWTYELGRIPVLGELFAWTLVRPLGPWLLPDALAEVFAPDAVPPDQVARSGAALALRPRSYLANQQDMNQLSEYMQTLSPHYREIALPLLVIHGDADVLVPFWNHGRRLQGVIPQARLLLLPNTGHAPHHTRMVEVADAIATFRDDVRSGHLAAARPSGEAWPLRPALPRGGGSE